MRYVKSNSSIPSGFYNRYGSSMADAGYRPVVCLKSGLYLETHTEQNGETTFTIEKS